MSKDEKKTTREKKEWKPPTLTILDVESATKAAPVGNALIDNAYS